MATLRLTDQLAGSTAGSFNPDVIDENQTACFNLVILLPKFLFE